MIQYCIYIDFSEFNKNSNLDIKSIFKNQHPFVIASNEIKKKILAIFS